MCLAVAGRIVEIYENIADIDIMGIITKANIQLIANPKVGDYVLIHTGCAIEKINQDYFDDLSNIYQDILDKDETR